jgi:prophage regulatory protein
MKLIRLTEVKELTGLGRSSIYKFMNEDMFPKSISLGERAVAWIDEEVEEWIAQRIEQRGRDTEINPTKPQENRLTELDVINWIKSRFKDANTCDVFNWLLGFINK